MTIHWCGTGLSAIPGLRRLIGAGHEVTVWNRSIDKAQDAMGSGFCLDYIPNMKKHAKYAELYAKYADLGEYMERMVK